MHHNYMYIDVLCSDVNVLWKKKSVAREREKKSVRGGIRTHAHICGPECFELTLASKEFILESGALDHSATLTAD